MHVSSFDNMRRCVKKHVHADPVLASRERLSVIDIGGADVNGSYRSLFGFTECDYTGIDIAAGPGTDVVLGPDGVLPYADRSVDVVVSGQTFEHIGTFWKVFAEMERVLADDGVLVLIAPSAGVVHRFPVDCYRFLPDSYHELATEYGLVLVDTWIDPKGPFHDLVGVFRRTPSPAAVADADLTAYVAPIDGGLQNDEPGGVEVPEHELRAGSMPTLAFLKQVHQVVEPRFYLEIGVFDGASLRPVTCPAIGIDPVPIHRFELRPGQRVHTGLSSDFFLDEGCVAELGPIDLAYIDGMHLLEHAYEDFVNVEAHAHRCSVVLVDDIFPNHPQQALRARSSRHWTGDVWKAARLIHDMRPDLIVLPVDTEPTGTLVVVGVDPHNTVMRDTFDWAIGAALEEPEVPPRSVLERTEAIHPSDPLLWRVLRTVRQLREVDDPTDGIDRLRRLVADAFPRQVSRSA